MSYIVYNEKVSDHMEQELWTMFIEEYVRQSSVFVTDDAIFCSVNNSTLHHIFGYDNENWVEYAKRNPPKWEYLEKQTWDLLCSKDPRYNSIKILYI